MHSKSVNAKDMGLLPRSPFQGPAKFALTVGVRVSTRDREKKKRAQPHVIAFTIGIYLLAYACILVDISLSC